MKKVSTIPTVSMLLCLVLYILLGCKHEEEDPTDPEPGTPVLGYDIFWVLKLADQVRRKIEYSPL